MKEKEIFVSRLKARSKKLAVDIIGFCEKLKKSKASAVITYQLVKSATSVGANYRAACNARSKPEFFSKICIVVEEADEVEYWLEIIEEAKLSENTDEFITLKNEAVEISKIMTAAKFSTYNKGNR